LIDYNLFNCQNIAKGEANAVLQQNQANVDSLIKIQNSQTSGYKILKEKLNFENKDLLNFVKTKLVKHHQGDNIVANILNPEFLKNKT